MTAKLRRWTRRRALILLALALTSMASRPARAPEPVPIVEEGLGEGRPLDGYFGTSILTFLALFVVSKSARR